MPRTWALQGGKLAAVTGGGRRLAYWEKVKAIQPANLIGYWMLDEAAGTSGAGSVIDSSGQANHGTPAAVTFGVAGIGDGKTAASFDGSTSVIDIYSAGFVADFSKAEGTLAGWAKVSGAGVWTDSAYHFLASVASAWNNRVFITKHDANNTLQWVYVANGTYSYLDQGGNSSTGWMHLAITWSKAADEVKLFKNGAQQAETKTGLGVWAGDLASNSVVIGAENTTPNSVWSGPLAHIAIWKAALTPAQIAALAVV